MFAQLRAGIAPALTSILLVLPAQAQESVSQSFTGKQFILEHAGEEREIKVKVADAGKVSGSCDVAVEVKKAAVDNRGARLELETIGRRSLQNKPASPCRKTTDITLEVSGSNDEAALAASVHRLLRTPEEYLADHAINFDRPPGPDDEPLGRGAGAGTKNPALLLKVDAIYSEGARAARVSGEVKLRFVVGTDGRVHNPSVATGLEPGLDKNSLRVLPMWRFEPAQRGDTPVASQAVVSMSFRLL